MLGLHSGTVVCDAVLTQEFCEIVDLHSKVDWFVGPASISSSILICFRQFDFIAGTMQGFKQNQVDFLWKSFVSVLTYSLNIINYNILSFFPLVLRLTHFARFLCFLSSKLWIDMSENNKERRDKILENQHAVSPGVSFDVLHSITKRKSTVISENDNQNK